MLADFTFVQYILCLPQRLIIILLLIGGTLKLSITELPFINVMNNFHLQKETYRNLYSYRVGNAAPCHSFGPTFVVQF